MRRGHQLCARSPADSSSVVIVIGRREAVFTIRYISTLYKGDSVVVSSSQTTPLASLWVMQESSGRTMSSSTKRVEMISFWKPTLDFNPYLGNKYRTTIEEIPTTFCFEAFKITLKRTVYEQFYGENFENGRKCWNQACWD